MKIKRYQVDAFTNKLFAGNPAAVCVIEQPISDGLMQAIARVNRVFKDKPGGLVVDYLGLAMS